MKREILYVAIVASLLGACKPKAGARCSTEGEERCVDEKRALACHAGTWEELSCRGPAGCSKAGAEHACDQSVAEAQDPCNLPNDYVCAGDRKSMLQCTKHRWTVVQGCLGERGCVAESKTVRCDNSVANAGDDCREEDDYACAPDKRAALVCRKGKFATSSLCKGPKGCRVTGTTEQGQKIECDDSLASVGDPCERDDHFSCSVDERAILKCKAKRFELDERCKPKERCQIRGTEVGCR